MSAVHFTANSSAGPIDPTALLDGSLNTTIRLTAPADGSPALLEFEFAEPYTARAFTLGSRGGILSGNCWRARTARPFAPSS